MNTKELLIKGLAIFHERGMAKGEFIDADNRVCVQGALYLALGTKFKNGQPNSYYGIEDAMDLLDAKVPTEFEGYHPDRLGISVEFNNNLNTTQQELERLFELAINDLRS